MVSAYLKLALNIFLLFVTQLLQPVAGQASPAATPCRGARITADSIKDGYVFREGLSPPLDPGLARTLNALHYEGKKSFTWSNASQYSIPFDHGSTLLTRFPTSQPRFPSTAKWLLSLMGGNAAWPTWKCMMLSTSTAALSHGQFADAPRGRCHRPTRGILSG